MIGMKSGVSLFRKFLTSKVPITKIRNLSTEKIPDDLADENTSKKPQIDRVKNSIKVVQHLNKLREYFELTDFDKTVDSMPCTIFKQRRSRPEHLYLFKHEVADDFVNLIRDDLVENPRKIIEANAGAGVLTEKLLNAGVPELTIMESQSKCVASLVQLQKKYPNRITIQKADLFNIWKITYRDKHDNVSRVSDLLSNYSHNRWDKNRGLQIIGAVPNVHFIWHLILDVVRQSGIVARGRPCLHICLPPSVWRKITRDQTDSLQDYRAIAVLFQLFFNHRLLGEIPRKAFLPWGLDYSRRNYANKSDQKQRDRDYMCVVRIEGKENLFTEVIDKTLIQPLWYFVTHHMVARSGRVIPHMEGWSPGCGPHLILKDYNIFTQFGDLSPQEYLQLFKDFTAWDGYESSFLPSLENSMQKMEQLTF